VRRYLYLLTGPYAPNLPHTYPYLEYASAIEKLLPYTRERYPQAFAFRTDTHEFTGRNGIEMDVPRSYGEYRTMGFNCRIDGAVVTIHSDRIEKLRVDCQHLGLADQEQVTIIWNNQEAYVGKPDVVWLGGEFRYRKPAWYKGLK
jgi:hypothetical protein